MAALTLCRHLYLCDIYVFCPLPYHLGILKSVPVTGLCGIQYLMDVLIVLHLTPFKRCGHGHVSTSFRLTAGAAHAMFVIGHMRHAQSLTTLFCCDRSYTIVLKHLNAHGLHKNMPGLLDEMAGLGVHPDAWFYEVPFYAAMCHLGIDANT